MSDMSLEKKRALSLRLTRPWPGGGGEQVSWWLRPGHLAFADGRVLDWWASVVVTPTDGTGWGRGWDGRVCPDTGTITWPAGAPKPPDEWTEQARRIVTGVTA